MTVHVLGEQFGDRRGIVFGVKRHGWIVNKSRDEQCVAQYKMNRRDRS